MPTEPSGKTVFESFQPYYDIMVDWDARLARESPLFQRVFQSVHAKRVLDAACGTGQHAALFARWGLEVSASDVAPAMVRQAEHLVASMGLAVNAKEVSFDQLSTVFDRPFDCIVCTGNSLSAAGKRTVVSAAIAEMFKLVRPGGALMLQVLNYDRFPPGENVYGEPIVRESLGQDYIFLKVFRRAGTTCDLDIIVMQRGANEIWNRTVFSERLLVLDEGSLVSMVEAAGFGRIHLYGGYDMAPFNRKTSQDLVLVARRE